MGCILVIEDDAAIRHNVARMLQLEGHAVQVAENGAAGLIACTQTQQQLVLCDVNMPGGLDGWQVLQTLRREHPAVRVVMLTALSEGESVDKAQSLGAAGYLLKPFTRAQLLATVNHQLA
jgi:CheY-like chemotaxis protein